MQWRRDDWRRPAFTIVELLVAIGILVVLLALLVPAVQKIRESTNRAQCVNNLKQLGAAFQSFHDNNGTLPAGNLGTTAGFHCSHSWALFLFPYLGLDSVYSQYNFGNATYGSSVYLDATNRVVMNRVMAPQFRCPSSPLPVWGKQTGFSTADEGYLLPSYVGISGSIKSSPQVGSGDYNWEDVQRSVGGLLVDVVRGATQFPSGKMVSLSEDVGDGTSNTMLVGEQSDWCYNGNGETSYCSASGFPNQIDYPISMSTSGYNNRNSYFFTMHLVTVRDRIGAKSASSEHATSPFPNTPIQSAHFGYGAHILFGDGSVRYLTSDLKAATFYSLADRNDGNVLDEEF